MPHSRLRLYKRTTRYSLVCLAALLGLLALAFIAAPAARAAGVIYVRSGASGANNGTSWTNAYTSLQSALSAASSGDQIWVAAGSYRPTSPAGRDATFKLTSGVAVYGGFAGSETQLSERNWTTNVTILSGDIGTSGDPIDNSYHVVTGATGATLDGFTISGGNANGSDTNIYGGGIYNYNSSPTLNNLIISANATGSGGGGIYNFTSSPILTNVTISGNSATSYGGGIANSSSSPTLTNVTISGNSAEYGGGIDNSSSSPTLTNVTISANSASLQGGGIYNFNSSPTLTNATISGNSAGIDGGGIYNLNSSPTLTNATISGNSAGSNGGGIYIYGAPKLTNVVVSGNTSNFGGGIYITNSSNATFTNVTISSNRAINQGGGIYSLSGSPKIRNSIIWGNRVGTTITSITSIAGPPEVSYSIVESGYSGTGNLDRDPQFISAVSAADAPTTSGDYRLQATSPAIDAGNNSVVSATTDLAGYPRRINVTGITDTGSGTPPIVDMGAYEAYFVSVSSIMRSHPLSSTTNATSVEFQVVFDQPLIGIDMSDFALTIVSGSLSGASITTVSGSDTTYNVTITTGTGDGVLRLDVPATGSATDSSNLPLGLFAFTNGEIYAIDKTAPAAPAITSITTDSGTDGDGITTDQTLVFSGSAEAGSTVTLTRIGVDVIGTTTADTNGDWSFDYTSTSLDDGNYSFTAAATDAASNISPSSTVFAVSVDVTPPPAPTITGITSDNGTQTSGVTRDSTISLNGTAEASSTVTLTRVGMDVIGTTTADTNGDWSFDYTGTPLPDGSYQFLASASDVAGNLSSESSAFTVTVDTTPPPAPTITGITTDSGFQASGMTSDPTISLNGTAEAGSTITLTRANLGVIGTTTADMGGVWSFDYTGTSLPFSATTFTATASDTLGNTSAASSNFVVRVRAVPTPGVIYVRSSASGANNGTSWADAYTSLQDALSVAASGDQIWVAAGTYTPGSQRNESFTLTNGAAVYGGFAGSETLLSERDWASNVTILSGDTGMVGTTSDNSYHVVVGASDATLDGFTISDGNANSSGTNANGGGIYTTAASPTLSNLIISGNQASDGGGIYNDNASSVMLTNVTLINNSAVGSGGGIYNNNSSPTLTNVTITDNTAVGSGGGIYNNNSSPTLTNVTVTDNTATNFNGGGIYNNNSSPTLTNVTITGNVGTDSASLGGGIFISGGAPILTNVIISGNRSGRGGGLFTILSNPTLTNVTIAGNRATIQGGGIHTVISNPQIRNSIIWSNRVGASVSSISIDNGTPAVSYSIVEGGYTGTGNLSSDPQYISAVAATSAPTTSGNYRLLTSSPAIDAGDNSVVSVTTDLTGNPRQIDLPTVADTGSGSTPVVDMGAYEALEVVEISSMSRLAPAASITSAASVQFQVVFAESVSAVETSDFAASVVSGSISSANITRVSGSGTTYSVTVNTGSGDGVLRLEPAPGAQVLNAASAIRAIAPFTSGESYIIDKSIATPVITGITTDSGFQTSGMTSDSTISLNGTAEAGNTVTLTRAGVVFGSVTADGSGAWFFDDTSTILQPGSYQFFVWASDIAGNISSNSGVFTVTVDPTPPAAPIIISITGDGGTPGDGVTNDRTLVLNGSAEAGSTVTLTRVGESVIGTATADIGGNWSFDYTSTSLDDGSYSFTATATDLAGNTGDRSTPFELTVDATPPAAPVITGITTDSGTQTSGVTRDSTINLNGTAEAGSTVTLTREGNDVIGTATADSNGAWSFDYTSTSLEVGSYSFTATATDLAGNSSDSSSAFVVTIVGPLLYVNDDATGANTGASWADAFTNLQSALAVAVSGDQIWVAEGTYRPTTSTDRAVSFALKSGVAVYGGFAGTETQLNERNWTTNISTLSGDLNIDDGADFANNGENSYHVVEAAAGATLDGFTVSGGNADGEDNQSDGGGIHSDNAANLTLANLTISGNSAGEGGGLYVAEGSATLANITFSLNHATERGGGVFAGSSNLIFNTVSITGSTSAGSSGGLYTIGGSVTLTNCTVSNNTAQTSAGGGVFIASGSVTLTNCTVSNNTAQTSAGGGMYTNGGNITLVDSAVSGNMAQGGGGLSIRSGSVKLVHSTVSNNTAQGAAGGGGMLTIFGSVTLENSTVSNNIAQSSGGGIFSRAPMTISGSTISGNTANDLGGGIFNQGSATLNISGSTISGNSANFGGGIDSRGAFTMTTSLVRDNIIAGSTGGGGGLRVESGVTMLTNTTLSGNHANSSQDDSGGGIMAYEGKLTLNNVTIAGNSTTGNGGGITTSISATVTLINTIVAGNSSSASTPDLSGTLISGGHNLIGDASGSTGITNGTRGDLVGTSAAPLDPKLGALANNGGLTQTRALLDGSPAIDTGDDATCVAIDQRGYIRINPCDIGAYELGARMLANQPPTLDQPADLTILEDASLQTVNLTGIGAGNGESQTINITATSSNPALIPNPTVSYTDPNASGSLSFTPVANANGTATITITMQDNGGTNGGGVDTLTRSFSVTITPVNDAPSFTVGANQAVAADAGQQTVTGWASGFNAGSANEASQTLLDYTIVSNSAAELFSVAPAIDASGTLTYTPKPGVSGTAIISVVVQDSGGTANGGVDTSAVSTFTITITNGGYQIFLPLVLGT